MGTHCSKRPMGVTRVVVETCVFIAVIAQSICWLSGWPLLSFFWNHGEPSTQSLVSHGNLVFALSPAVKEMMKQVGIVHSVCYEPDRTNLNEFLLCMGRTECSHARREGSAKLVAAPEALESPEGKRKVLEVTHTVLSHVAKRVQSGDLKVILEKVSSLGLACDNFQTTSPPR